MMCHMLVASWGGTTAARSKISANTHRDCHGAHHLPHAHPVRFRRAEASRRRAAASRHPPAADRHRQGRDRRRPVGQGEGAAAGQHATRDVRRHAGESDRSRHARCAEDLQGRGLRRHHRHRRRLADGPRQGGRPDGDASRQFAAGLFLRRRRRTQDHVRGGTHRRHSHDLGHRQRGEPRRRHHHGFRPQARHRQPASHSPAGADRSRAHAQPAAASHGRHRHGRLHAQYRMLPVQRRQSAGRIRSRSTASRRRGNTSSAPPGTARTARRATTWRWPPWKAPWCSRRDWARCMRSAIRRAG